MNINDVTEQIIGGAIQVHAFLGPGLLESTYERCLALEFAKRGLRFTRQVPIDIVYHETRIESAYKVDMIVENCVNLELKAVSRIDPIHLAQMISYLRLSRLNVGLLINFTVTALPKGIRRVVLGLNQPVPRFPRVSR